MPEEKSTNPNKWIFIGILAGIVGIFLLLCGAGGVVALNFGLEAARSAERQKKQKADEGAVKRLQDEHIRLLQQGK